MSNYEKALRTYLSQYKHPDATRREVTKVLLQYKDLRPSYDSFIFNDGRQKNLLNLEGTIPVNYRGGVYNIPVCIWIVDSHPYTAPMVFVRPTDTMQIKPNRSVDSNGMVGLPYLRDWNSSSCDLGSLVQILVLVFGEESPVYARVPTTEQDGSQTPTPSEQGPAGEDPEGWDDQLYRQIKQEFCRQVNPILLLPYLNCSRSIDERISEIQESQGRGVAAHQLLLKLVKHQRTWVTDLCEALRHYDLKLDHLADFIKEKQRLLYSREGVSTGASS